MDSSFLERLAQLETRFKKFSIVGTDDVLVAGNLKSGFTVNIGIQGSGLKGGGGGGGGGTGACCYDDGTCDVLTEIDCTNAGGNYQGDGTNCSITGICLGACCEGDGGHTCVPNSTPDSCAADGGTFQGFGRTCDPDPCALPICCGSYFVHDGHFYLTKTVRVTGTAACDECRDGPCDSHIDASCTTSINLITCMATLSCSGTSFVEQGAFSETITLGVVDGHSQWSNASIASTGNWGFCGECNTFCPTSGGFLENLTTPCSGSCTEPTPSPCAPTECCGSRNLQITITYSNECTPLMGGGFMPPP